MQTIYKSLNQTWSYCTCKTSFKSSHHIFYKCDYKQYFTDLSVISMNDAGTGIQRLVKSLWTRLPAQNHSINFVPLYATRKKKYAISHYPNANLKKRNYVQLKTGDLFFGLDWSADQIIQHQAQLFEWKMCGAKMVFILNYILALQHPDWFTKKIVKNLKHGSKLLQYAQMKLFVFHKQ